MTRGNTLLENVSKLNTFIRMSKSNELLGIYIDKIINENKDVNFDYVLIILGQSFSKENIETLKSKFNTAKFVYYTWDSSKNFPAIKEIKDVFDVAYSFDSEDCLEYGFKFLPLFYSNDYIENENEFDCSLITTIKPGKLSKIQELIDNLPKDITLYKHLYLI